MTTSASQLPWLPLAKAAEKVSELTEKHHSEADILRAALAGHLTLSVQLVSPVFARQGHFQKLFQDAPHGISANVSLLCAGNGVEREKSVLPDFLGIGDVAFAYSSDQGEYVQGLLDLLLIRNGKTHVQNLERRLHGDCEGYLLPSGGIYLKGPTGIFWELQEQLDNDSTRSDDHEIEHTPAERFHENWRIVVRPSELEWLLSFHEKPTPPVAAPPTTAETEMQPASSQESLAAEADVDPKSLPSAMDKVPGKEKLCKAFGYSSATSYNAVRGKVDEYNKRFPEDRIEFGRIGRTPYLHSWEVWKIIEKMGNCTGKRTKKKTRKKT